MKLFLLKSENIQNQENIMNSIKEYVDSHDYTMMVATSPDEAIAIIERAKNLAISIPGKVKGLPIFKGSEDSNEVSADVTDKPSIIERAKNLVISIPGKVKGLPIFKGSEDSNEVSAGVTDGATSPAIDSYINQVAGVNTENLDVDSPATNLSDESSPNEAVAENPIPVKTEKTAGNGLLIEFSNIETFELLRDALKSIIDIISDAGGKVFEVDDLTGVTRMRLTNDWLNKLNGIAKKLSAFPEGKICLSLIR